MNPEHEKQARAQAERLAYETRNARVARKIGPAVADVRRRQRLVSDGPPYTPTERQDQRERLAHLQAILERIQGDDRLCQQYDDGRALVHLEKANLDLQARHWRDGTGETWIDARSPWIAFYIPARSSKVMTVILRTWHHSEGNGPDLGPVPVQWRNSISAALDHLAAAIQADEDQDRRENGEW